MKKYADKGNALNALLDHVRNEREVRERRENVDPKKIDRNYCLTFREDNLTDREFIDKRLGELEYRERKDTVKLVSIAISLPKDYHGDPDKFFESCARFLGDRYGANNVVGVYVHKDEWNAKTHEPIQDHAHALVIPVINRNRELNPEEPERLNAKKWMSRTELSRFHGELEKHLEKEHIHARVLNGATRDQREYIQSLEHSRDFLNREIENDRDAKERLDKYLAQQREIDKDIERQTREERDREQEHEHSRAPKR